MEDLIKRVFGNIVIFRLIYKYVRLYKKNECLTFYDLESLREYKEREYIKKIVYNSKEMIKLGDLPIGCVLKEVVFNEKQLLTVQGEAIPYGVEIIQYSCSYNLGGNDDLISSTPFPTLPSSIHTINNAILAKNSELSYLIPPNIKSISFFSCPVISSMVIPNTIRTLEFPFSWDNDNVPLKKGDIPEGVTKLSIINYDIKKLSKGILPNSIKELTVSINIDEHKQNIGEILNFLPLYIEDLSYIISDFNITPELNLSSYTSLKKLSIDFKTDIEEGKVEIRENSLPSSLKELAISGITKDFSNIIIPKSVTILDLVFNFYDNNFIPKGSIPNSVLSISSNAFLYDGVLPPSLTHLELTTHFNENSLKKMLFTLPISLTSLTIPSSYKDNLNITFPSTINKLSYRC